MSHSQEPVVGFRVSGLGFEFIGFWVKGLGFGFIGFEFRVWVLGL